MSCVWCLGHLLSRDYQPPSESCPWFPHRRCGMWTRLINKLRFWLLMLFSRQGLSLAGLRSAQRPVCLCFLSAEMLFLTKSQSFNYTNKGLGERCWGTSLSFLERQRKHPAELSPPPGSQKESFLLCCHKQNSSSWMYLPSVCLSICPSDSLLVSMVFSLSTGFLLCLLTYG